MRDSFPDTMLERDIMNERTYNAAVTNIQRYIRRIYDNDRSQVIFAVPIDGIYDTATRAAVSEFQRSMSLPITGIVDRNTHDTLFSEYLRISKENDRSISPDLFLRYPMNYETKTGEKSNFVFLMQMILNDLRNVYDTIPSFETSGVFDEDTSLAIKEFQRISTLPITGRVDRVTWNTLSKAFNIYGK